MLFFALELLTAADIQAQSANEGISYSETYYAFPTLSAEYLQNLAAALPHERAWVRRRPTRRQRTTKVLQCEYS